MIQQGTLEDNEIIITPSKAIRRSEFIEKTERCRELRKWAKGHSVAIWLNNPIDFLKALYSLIGAADDVLLLPRTLNVDLVKHFLALNGTSKVISDMPIAVDHMNAIGLEYFEKIEHVNEDAASDAQTKILIGTSGTTGTPKLVVHDFSSISATVKKDQSKGSGIRWGLLYDPARFAGMQVVIQSLLGGSALVIPEVGSPIKDSIEFFIKSKVNAISATPTFWRKILALPKAQLLELKLITLGGEIVDQKILSALKATYKDAVIRHIYASTEAGVGFSVSDCNEGFPKKWLEKAPNNIEIKIDKNSQLLIRTPHAASRYVGLNLDKNDEGWIATGDAVYIDGDRVKFHGRINGSINIGGDKVFPEDVQKVILQHQSCRDVIVKAKKSPFTGNLVEAEIALRANFEANSTTKSDILRHCKEHLPPYAVPALIRFVDDISYNVVTGKQERH